MSSRFMVFDPFCNYLTDLEVDTTPRRWVLNDVGDADFPISPNDPKATYQNLHHGNFIHIQHVPTKNNDGSYNGKLPSWTGIILRDPTWNEGVMNWKAHSAEALATVRPLPWVDKVTGTPKFIFQNILDGAAKVASRYGGVVIQPGTIEDKAVVLSDDFRQQMYEHIVNIVKRARMTWSITGEIDSKGKLNLYGNLYASAGRVSGLTLTNINSELSSPLLRQQGTPYNVVIGHSQAQTQRARYEAVGVNADSLAAFGFLGKNATTYMGVHDPSSLQTAVQAEADIYGQPFDVMDRNALDVGQTFSYLQVGDSVHVDERGAGWNPNGGKGIQADATILSMAYNDVSNKVTMKLEKQ